MNSVTHHTLLQIWWLPVEHIRGLDAVLDDAYSAVEQTHQVTRYLPRVVREHLAVLLTDRDEELVDGHGRVYRDLAPEERLNLVFLHRFGRMLGQQASEPLDTHLYGPRTMG